MDKQQISRHIYCFDADMECVSSDDFEEFMDFVEPLMPVKHGMFYIRDLLWKNLHVVHSGLDITLSDLSPIYKKMRAAMESMPHMKLRSDVK